MISLSEKLRIKIAKRLLRTILILSVVAAAFAAYSLYVSSSLTQKDVRIAGTGLPPMRIAALSDVHTGSVFITPEKLRKVVDQMNSQNPDIVILLGDYVIHDVLGGTFIESYITAEELGKLKAKYGVFAVMGNHDWWYDGPGITREFEKTGIRVLEDESIEIKTTYGKFWLTGIADFLTRNPDPTAAIRNVPKGEPILAFTHNPDIFPQIDRRVSLTAAGHTHGGQIRLPVIGAPMIPSIYGQRYGSGIIQEDGKYLFVTTGLGTSILPLRFRVPPEYAIITIQ